MSENETSTIRMTDIDFAYPGRPRHLRGLSFEFKGGKLGLLGPNGAGKSTLFLLIMGLLFPNEGHIEVFGKQRTKEADFKEVRRRIGLLFQDADDQLFSPTVGEDVAFGPLNLRLPKDEVRRVVADTLVAVGLKGYEDRITHRLSGGERRLAALASVLAMQPELLLLDEPFSGLDERARQRMENILSQDRPFILIDHDPKVLEKTCDGIMILEDGKVRAG